MESHRLRRAHTQPHSPRGSQEDLFGVRVRVQGYKGQPFVVLNSSGEEMHGDISVIAHQEGYNPGMVRTSVEETLGQKRNSVPGFNFQRHPEILKPYDPDSNDLNLLVPSPTPTVARPSSLNVEASQKTKARIPLPAEGPEEDVADAGQDKSSAPGGHATTRSPNSVDTGSILSVGNLINQFNSAHQQRGRRGPRSRLNPEECRRSRSVDSGRTSDSSTSSSSSSRTSSLKAARPGVPAGGYAPGSARARLFGAENALAGKREGTKTDALPKGHHSGGAVPSQAGKQLLRSDTLVVSASSSDKNDDERDAQVTPDLLKGQQELSVDQTEDTAKQILFTYLKDGTTDSDSTIQRKVDLLFEGISKLKWTTTEGVVEEEKERDHAAEVRLLREKQAGLKKEVAELKNKVAVEIKNEKTLARACEKAREGREKLQEELDKSQAEISKLRARLESMEAELQATKQELTRMKAERDRSKTEMKDLQQQLSEMHDELDQVAKSEEINVDREVLLKEMTQLHADFEEMLLIKEEQEQLLHRRERELSALKGALKEEVETHDKEMTILKEEYDKELQKLIKDVEMTIESNAQLGQEKMEAEEQRGAAKVEMRRLSLERVQLAEKVQGLEDEVEQLNHTIKEVRASEKQLEQRANQLERETLQLEDMLTKVRNREEEMSQSNQSLITRLEDTQSKLSKLNHEHKELREKLREEQKQMEVLWRTKNELEEQRKQQDKIVEQLQRKMNIVMEECEVSTDTLQSQVDEARERSRREAAELQKQLQEKGAELEKSRQAVQKLQEEVLPLEEDLLRCRREHQEAQQRGRQLQQKVEELEERNAGTADERDRQVKLMEGRISQIMEDLDEERSSADRLMDRLDKTKEQMDQMRSELLQERALRQDLECDKMSLERQNKDLKSRVTHLEGSQKTNQDSLLSKLSGRIQELEERLQGEERDNNNLQQVNRKLERKVKELKLQADEEHINLQSQRDQLTQRLKTAKRQMDEAEEEIERLEHAKKKLQRDLDEQMEANEQLHSQISSMRAEMRRKKKSSPLMVIVEDDVTDGDDIASD